MAKGKKFTLRIERLSTVNDEDAACPVIMEGLDGYALKEVLEVVELQTGWVFIVTRDKTEGDSTDGIHE